MKKIIFILSIAVSLLVVFGCPAVLTNPNKSAFVEPLSGEVGLNGTPAFRSTLTANISGLSGNAFSYQWMRVDPEGKASVPIAGADGSSYTIRSADIRNRVSVVVTQPATGASIEGGPSPLVYDPEKPALSGSVTISGGSSPMPGSVLTADVSNLTGDGATFYTWSREGITVGIDVSYTVKDSDMGKKLTLVVVKANNSSSATDSTGMVGGPLPMPNPILPIEPGGGGINPSNTDTSPSRAAQRFTTLVSGQNKYEEFFPNKDDFYAYSELIKAIRQMAYIQLRISTIYDSNIMFSSWLLYVERNDKSEGNDYQLIYDNSNGQLSNMDSSWSSGNGTNTTIDFGNFLYDPVNNNMKRELAAFFAHITQETTGVLGDGATRAEHGLYYKEAVGWNALSKGGYTTHPSDPRSKAWPPNPEKSYHPRGPVGLSGNENYGLFSAVYYGDKDVLLNNPELLTDDAALAFASAIWFWMMPQLPVPSSRTVLPDSWDIARHPAPPPPPFTPGEPKGIWVGADWEPGFGASTMVFTRGVEEDLDESDFRMETRIKMYEKVLRLLNGNTFNGEKVTTKGMKAIDVQRLPFGSPDPAQ